MGFFPSHRGSSNTISSLFRDGFGGASAALPHAVGVAALILEQYPSINQSQMKSLLIWSSLKNLIRQDATKPNSPNLFLNVQNMFNRTVKITDLSATTTSNLFTWYPKVKVTMKFTDDVASQLAWRGTYLVKGRFSTGDVVGCVVDQVVQANQTFTCDMPTVGFAKLKRRYVEFDIISVGEAANITFDATGTNRFGIRFWFVFSCKSRVFIKKISQPALAYFYYGSVQPHLKYAALAAPKT